ncbi:putative polysaccharide biosynthesis protein [Paenibacillus xerothermodurans]|uniref:Polysaccharide biosynthesis protein n=1 Tax=Paenibacillus xerothermodurans TaxID=1977292 RepID=A0A2W1NU58_PAEXE|nr:polysaccharide biosynthesis protein [Paenibacillus xerothermodurans]PZE21286.1 polysaccharide biosynthesis protein [Paenibacillus xerothermodurans]
MLSKDSLVKGTFILTVAALIARLLGVVQRIPLIVLLGDLGMAAYGVAFNLYAMLLVIATAGIPSALSKMISERTALGQHAEANRIYRAALLFAAAAGVVMTLLLYVFAPYYADGTANPQAVLPIQALAPALLLFPLIAIMRGYFQGRRMMMPNGLSQIIEQIFRVGASVGLAYVLLDYSLDWAVAGASFGGVVGSVAAAAVMVYYSLKLRRTDRAEGLLAGAADTWVSPSTARSNPLTYKSIYAQLFKISIPIVIFSLTVTLIYTIDSSIVTLLLMGQLGQAQAQEILGILLGRAQSLAGIPIILAVALSQSVVPIISAAYSRGDMSQVSQHTSKVLQLSLLTGIPMALIICVAAGPIDALVFGNDRGSVIVDQFAAPIIIVLTISSIFQIVMQTSGAVLMGMGKMKPLMLHVAVGIAVKLIGSYLLAPVLGIYGIIAATGLCFIVMTVLNLRVLRQVVSFRVLGRRRWTGLIVVTSVITAIGAVLNWVTGTYIQPFGHPRADAFVQTVILCLTAGGLYPLLLFITRTVSVADIQHMPGPVQRLIGRVAPRLLRARQESTNT